MILMRDNEKIEILMGLLPRFESFFDQVKQGDSPLTQKTVDSFDRYLSVLTRSTLLCNDPVAQLMGEAWLELTEKFMEPTFLGYPSPPLKLKAVTTENLSDIMNLIREAWRIARLEYAGATSRMAD